MLFVETEEIRLPETTCTLSVTPLVTELFRRIVSLPETEATTGHARLLYQVLLEELSTMPVSGLSLPISGNSHLKAIAEAIIDTPSVHKTGNRPLIRPLETATASHYGHPAVDGRCIRRENRLGSRI